MTKPPFDYDRYEEGRGVNYWELNPPLQEEVHRTYPADEFEWAEERLTEFGAVVGETIADNADRIDDHEPELQTYDKHGDLLNEVHYHPDHRVGDEFLPLS
ncbi:hypothetical protein [Saliphagus infecundisoli]|uniref:Adaptive response protein AidB N-terminal domain-containing protein n=1 Tax=Saliphagus infecundisoli TaxID=1849069 RepID=A0ABD5QKJ0_9EURY|nr:hypothetical protein [Saliphagus infecundisoli]